MKPVRTWKRIKPFFSPAVIQIVGLVATGRISNINSRFVLPVTGFAWELAWLHESVLGPRPRGNARDARNDLRAAWFFSSLLS